MLPLLRISLKGMKPLFKKTRLFYIDLFQMSENNCEQLLAYNTKFTEDMQLVFSIITVRWIIFIVVVAGLYSQTMECGISTYVLFRGRVLCGAILRYNSILRAGTTIGTECPFFFQNFVSVSWSSPIKCISAYIWLFKGTIPAWYRKYLQDNWRVNDGPSVLYFSSRMVI